MFSFLGRRFANNDNYSINFLYSYNIILLLNSFNLFRDDEDDDDDDVMEPVADQLLSFNTRHSGLANGVWPVLVSYGLF